MRKIISIATILLAVGCSKDAYVPKVSPAPTIKVDPAPPKPEPSKPKKITWLPINPYSKFLISQNCFIFKFKSHDSDLKNNLLEKLVNEKPVVDEIYSSFIPVVWDDDKTHRGVFEIPELDDSFAGLVAVPLKDEDKAFLIKIDTGNGNKLDPIAPTILTQVLKTFNCGCLAVPDYYPTDNRCETD